MNKIAPLTLLGIGMLLLAQRAKAALDTSSAQIYPFDPRAFFPDSTSDTVPSVIVPEKTLDYPDAAQWWGDIENLFTPAVAPESAASPDSTQYPDASSWWGDIENLFNPVVQTPVPETQQSTAQPTAQPIVDRQTTGTDYVNNLNAFLQMLRTIESGNNYYSLAGGGNWTGDLSKHPADQGWPGYKRPDGRLSTAAGGYQITKSTFNTVKQYVPLPDFSPQSQDIAAVQITQFPWRQNAYGDILQGNFDLAVLKLKNEWESLGLILSNQYAYTMPQIRQMYADAGGVIKGKEIVT